MDGQEKYKKRSRNPRSDANLLSVITFSWLSKIFWLGFKKDLQVEDLYSPLKTHTSSLLGSRMKKMWDAELKRCSNTKRVTQPSLLRILIKSFGPGLMKMGVVLALYEFPLRIYQPVILAKLLHYLSLNDEKNRNEMLYWAVAFISCSFIEAFVTHHAVHYCMHIGQRCRVACSALIYRKILRMSNSVLKSGSSVGQMVNLLSNDVERLDYGVFSFHYSWIAPIQTLIIAYLVYQEVGLAAVVGLFTFLLFIPVQALIAKYISRFTRLSAFRTDERLRLVNEIVNGVQVIKMYAWEKPFTYLVEKARRKEIRVIKKFAIIDGLIYSFDCYVPRLSLCVTVISYIFLGNYISAEKVYMITAFYNVLRNTMAVGFAMSMNQIVQAMVSIKRLQKFLLFDELEEENAPKTDKIIDDREENPYAIALKNISAKWTSDSKENTIDNLNLSITPGSLVAIVGQVGAGKSSLLHVIMQELPLTQGNLKINGKFSYSSQEPWLFASSVRQNIIFGETMNESRYREVLRVCQLKTDISMFPHGDGTLLGARGINLSGGQRARINLARAVYVDADIYLLDDPLSAVDPHVGKSIVNDCICGFLKSKTRILVTHQLHFLKDADLIIVMNDGVVEARGTFSELQASGIDLMEFIKSENNPDEKSDIKSELNNVESIDYVNNATAESMLYDVEDQVEETRTLGKVSGKVYLTYFKSAKNPFLILIMLMIFVANLFVASGSDYFLAYWVNIEQTSLKHSANNETVLVWQHYLSRDQCIYIYLALIVTTVITCNTQDLIFFDVCMRISKTLHANMYRSVIRATMYFFNTNPTGRILNRFSKDFGNIDMRLPFSMYDVANIAFILTGTIAIIGIVNPWLLIPICVTAFLFYLLRIFYVATSRSIKRLEGITRSPVFEHLTATLHGLTTIRVSQAQKIVTMEFDRHLDLHSSAWYLFISTSRAFGLYLEIFCMLFNATITFSLLLIDDIAVISDVGLVITQILVISGLLQWGIRQTTELENQMTSVERVMEYSRLEEEPFLDKRTDVRVPENWPSKGLVEFKNVKLRYGENGPYILKDISFVAQPCEKIGIVGRTGAGKSTLINALFRLAIIEGEIKIDGIDTGSISLADFRSKISIIPQEPVLFAGTLRQNLDPFEEYSDDVLWQALDEVELKDTVDELVAGLQSMVSEGGTNFSVGQRQLLCLARALVRNNKIMILDEATANVDPQTDSLIQQTVRRKFYNCTVFTIAHRLNTIMDSAKVLVMDGGNAIEFDHPYILLKNKGHFYSMVQQTGPDMAHTLTEVAENNYNEMDNEIPVR